MGASVCLGCGHNVGMHAGTKRPCHGTYGPKNEPCTCPGWDGPAPRTGVS